MRTIIRMAELKHRPVDGSCWCCFVKLRPPVADWGAGPGVTSECVDCAAGKHPNFEAPTTGFELIILCLNCFEIRAHEGISRKGIRAVLKTLDEKMRCKGCGQTGRFRAFIQPSKEVYGRVRKALPERSQDSKPEPLPHPKYRVAVPPPAEVESPKEGVAK